MSRRGALSDAVPIPSSIYCEDELKASNLTRTIGPDGHTYIQHGVFNSETKHERWPTRTNIACYHDGEPFHTVPVCIPAGYNPETNTYETFGVVCSGSCAKAFMMDRPSYRNAGNMLLLNKLMRDVFGVHSEITEAPSRFRLIKYGGDLTIERFRELSCLLIRTIVHTGRMVTKMMVFEQTVPDAKGMSVAPVGSLSSEKGGQWNVHGITIPDSNGAMEVDSDFEVVASAAPPSETPRVQPKRAVVAPPTTVGPLSRFMKKKT